MSGYESRFNSLKNEISIECVQCVEMGDGVDGCGMDAIESERDRIRMAGHQKDMRLCVSTRSK